MTRSRDQLRSEFAWKVVEGVPAPKREEFQRIAVGAPAMIMSNGWMQSLAYYETKGAKTLVGAVCRWLAEHVWRGDNARGEFPVVMTRLQGLSSDDFMLATEETLELLRWVRQFAKAVR